MTIMMLEFVTYSDGTLAVSSDIRKKDGNYTKKDIELFKSLVEREASYFF